MGSLARAVKPPTAMIAAWSNGGSIAPRSRTTQALVSSISSSVPSPGSRRYRHEVGDRAHRPT